MKPHSCFPANKTDEEQDQFGNDRWKKKYDSLAISIQYFKENTEKLRNLDEKCANPDLGHKLASIIQSVSASIDNFSNASFFLQLGTFYLYISIYT